jgi:HEAT repeat protein
MKRLALEYGSMTEAFSEDAYRNKLGLKNPAEIGLAEEIVTALGKLDRALLPAAASHPYAELITQGTSSVPALCEMLDKNDLRQSYDALDALGHIFVYAPASDDAILTIRSLLDAQDIMLSTLAAKVLAIGNDRVFLHEQLSRLADEDPGVVATAARLLGLGRYQPVVPVLRALVSPDRIFESRDVIWALGEIGDPAALETLDYALGSAFRTVDCLIAMGKIGQVISIPKIMPMIQTGLPEQRDAAYRALAMILASEGNRHLVQRVEELAEGIPSLIRNQLRDLGERLSGSTRFHMLLCLARFGQKLERGEFRTYLGIELKKEEMSGVQAFFAGRK